MIAEKFQVLVVGCGASGMAAADFLQNQGVKVKVVEGNSRIGGRIRTVFDLGFPLDLGASWIHGHKNNSIFELAQKFNIPLVEFDYKDAFVVVDGCMKDTEKVMERLPAFKDMLEKASSKADPSISTRELADYVIKKEALDGDDKSLFEMYLSFEVEEYFGIALDKLASTAIAVSEVPEGEDFLIPLGYNSIFQKVAESLDISLDCPVVRIDQSRETEVELYCSNGAHFKGDYLICTLPLGILKSGKVQFAPALSPKKKESVAKLGFGTLDKVVMVFDQVFWPDNMCLRICDSQNGDYVFIVNLHRIWDVPALMCFIPNSAKAKYSKEAAQLDYSLRMLKSAFPKAAINLQSHVTTNWGEEPFTQGCYSSLAKDSGIENMTQFTEPDGRIFFAGEHTYKSDAASVNGAWNSGLVAAKEVLQLLSKN